MGLLSNRIADRVRDVEADPAKFKRLSRNERIAVAAVLDRNDLIKLVGIKNLDEAESQLGPMWWQAVLTVKQARH